MGDIAIRVENLSKRYRIGRREPYRALRDILSNIVYAPFRFRSLRQSKAQSHHTADSYIWALKGVSFEVKHGEIIGIIGRNGAGKSTLLKILSRITDPTEGYAEIHGRVGSLLEVGIGFHPELTGRENIYLNGAILGMKKREIDRKFDEIVAFSEIEKFIDTPVKYYSSGMYVRLAFAVAAHLDPEILLVDEVLAVGDAGFQKKCLGKMQGIAKEGRTVMFVSHDMGAISSLTQKCIYLRNGQIATFDESKKAVKQYLTDTIEYKDKAGGSLDFYRRNFNPDSPVLINRIWVNDYHRGIPNIPMGTSLKISIEVNAIREIRGAFLLFILKREDGERVTLVFSWDQNFSLHLTPGRHVVTAHIKDLCLTPGTYLVSAGISQSVQTLAYDVIIDFPLFRIVNEGQVTHWPERPWGTVHCRDIVWEISEV